MPDSGLPPAKASTVYCSLFTSLQHRHNSQLGRKWAQETARVSSCPWGLQSVSQPGQVRKPSIALRHLLVFWGCCNKLPQTWWLKTRTLPNSQFWRPEVQSLFHGARIRVTSEACGGKSVPGLCQHPPTWGHITPGSAVLSPCPSPFVWVHSPSASSKDTLDGT